MNGETNWYECEGCGKVIDPANVYEDPLPVYEFDNSDELDCRGRFHVTHTVDIGTGSSERKEECGPVMVVCE